MNILINASTIKIGGGKSVALNLVQALIKINTEHTLYLLVLPEGFEQFKPFFQGRLIFVHPGLTKWLFRWVLDYVWLTKKIKKISPDVIFSLGNLPVPIKNFPQALLFDNPFVISDKYEILPLNFRDRIRHIIRNGAFSNRLKYLTLIFPQTEIQKKLLERKYTSIPDMVVVPNTYNSLEQSKGDKFKSIRIKGIKNLLLFSYYYPHKNIEIVVDLARLVDKEKLPYRFILTLDEKQDKRVKKLFMQIHKYHLENTVINMGSIHIADIDSLYKIADALFLPTLIESFSSTCMDAMIKKVPVFISDLDFAHEVCKEAAYYFPPENPEKIKQIISYAFRNGAEMSEKVEKGYQLAKENGGWKQIAGTYLHHLEKLID